MQKHYICLGGCKGVSQVPGVCQAPDCSRHNHKLVRCRCKDNLHHGFKPRKGKKLIIFLVFVMILVSLSLFFYPRKISNGCGLLPCEYIKKCRGVYVQTYDLTGLDGGAGGKCFGVVEKIKNDKYEETMNFIFQGDSWKN